MSQHSEDLSAVCGGGVGEIMLFGVRVKVDPMRKSVSMNNLSEYEPVHNNINPSDNNNEVTKAAAEDGGAAGYASADDSVPQPSNGSRERKRGVPWTEEEHKRFLIGLQKVGRGDWRGISRNYVKTRTPTQVASHAQKYFLRRSNLNRRRRRTSLFDMTTDSVTAMPVEENNNHQENPTPPVLSPTKLPLPKTSDANGFPVVPFPVTAGPVFFSMQSGNQIENSVLGRSYLAKDSPSMTVSPVSVLHIPTSSTTMDLNLKQQVQNEPSVLSLKLSLSLDQDQTTMRDSAFQMMPGLKNGENVISVS